MQEIHARFMSLPPLPDPGDAWQLPTRPTKRTNVRSRGFRGESVEVDAILPAQLRGLVRECIERHMDPQVLDRVQAVEGEELKILRMLAVHTPAPRNDPD